MKQKPEKGQTLWLFANARVSKTELLIPVTCFSAEDAEPPPNESGAKVSVVLPDASLATVTRADVGPTSSSSTFATENPEF